MAFQVRILLYIPLHPDTNSIANPIQPSPVPVLSAHHSGAARVISAIRRGRGQVVVRAELSFSSRVYTFSSVPRLYGGACEFKSEFVHISVLLIVPEQFSGTLSTAAQPCPIQVSRHHSHPPPPPLNLASSVVWHVKSALRGIFTR
eukprot:1735335-Rhodomonas_salina.2